MLSKELLDLGDAYVARGDVDMARRSYSRAIALYPTEIAAYERLCRLALDEGDHPQALAFVDKGLAVSESAASLWTVRGIVFSSRGERIAAKLAFQTALTHAPDHSEATTHIAKLLIQEHNLQDAEALLLRTAHTQNDFAIYLTLADCLYRQHRFAAAQESVAKALAIDPANAEAHLLLAKIRFSTGDLATAWKEYEWRFQLPNWNARRAFSRKPQWLGEPLHGASILVHAEQGFGDSMQFVRFVNELAKRDCEIIVDIQPELYKLCSSSMELANVRWSRSEKVPASDLHIPMVSLPAVLGITYDNLPTFKPYVFAREREVIEWRGKLNKLTGIAWGRELERSKQRRIGIVWAGSAANPDDRNRSMTFDTVRPLIDANRDRAIFFSLQKDQRCEHPDVIDLGESLVDFAITAAIIENLDLVISVDTSIVHLAGAMGKQVWTMLSHTPDWRWVIGKSRTKWYPTMSLYAQQSPGDWSNVIQEINADLAE